MYQKLVSHNDDIRRLVKRGYAVAFDSNYLVIRDIPYLDSGGNLQIGAFVSKLKFLDNDRVEQQDHQLFFSGSNPFGLDGKPIPNLGARPQVLPLSDSSKDVIVKFVFSNKPKSKPKFDDLFEKIESYVKIISGPAMEKNNATTPYTFRIVKTPSCNSVFEFHDTLTSLAEIGDLSDKLKNDVVAVIGLGGTGAYIFDFLTKTPVREIRAFDHDQYNIHNAFRSPGRLEAGELGKAKAEVYQSRYQSFRSGLKVKQKVIDASCSAEVDGVTFAFVCVDQGLSRKVVFELLSSKKIPFIDVGMGLNRKQGPINGMLRTTCYSAEEGVDASPKKSAPLANQPNDIYETNIQIAELNALNACLAVVKFKQLRGFYLDENENIEILFTVSDLKLFGQGSDEV